MATHTSSFPAHSAVSVPTSTHQASSLAGGGPAPHAHSILKIRRQSNGEASNVNNTPTEPPQVPQIPPQAHQNPSPFVFVDPSVNLSSIKNRPRAAPNAEAVIEPEQTEESLSENDKTLLSYLTEDVCREVFKDRPNVSLQAKLVVAKELNGQDYFQLDKSKKMSISMKRKHSPRPLALGSWFGDPI